MSGRVLGVEVASSRRLARRLAARRVEPAAERLGARAVERLSAMAFARLVARAERLIWRLQVVWIFVVGRASELVDWRLACRSSGRCRPRRRWELIFRRRGRTRLIAGPSGLRC